jgi:hypothetical protein
VSSGKGKGAGACLSYVRGNREGGEDACAIDTEGSVSCVWQTAWQKGELSAQT